MVILKLTCFGMVLQLHVGGGEVIGGKWIMRRDHRIWRKIVIKVSDQGSIIELKVFQKKQEKHRKKRGCKKQIKIRQAIFDFEIDWSLSRKQRNKKMHALNGNVGINSRIQKVLAEISGLVKT